MTAIVCTELLDEADTALVEDAATPARTPRRHQSSLRRRKNGKRLTVTVTQR